MSYVEEAIKAFNENRWEDGLAAAKKTDYSDSLLCDWIGYCYNNGKGVAKDSAEAFKWFSKAAEKNSAWSMNELGRCYEYGWGVAADRDRVGTGPKITSFSVACSSIISRYPNVFVGNGTHVGWLQF